MMDEAYGRAMAIAPKAMRPGGRLLAAALVIGGIAVFTAMCWDLRLAPAAMVAGADKLGRFARAAFPPSDGGQFPRILKALAETFAMAFAATTLAAMVAVPLGVLGAKTVWWSSRSSTSPSAAPWTGSAGCRPWSGR